MPKIKTKIQNAKQYVVDHKGPFILGSAYFAALGMSVTYSVVNYKTATTNLETAQIEYATESLKEA